MEQTPGNRVLVIAEVGFNHGGDMNLASEMIRVAAAAGADCVKFQSYSAEGLVLRRVSHFDAIKVGELTTEDHLHLARTAESHGIEFLSTPYDERQVDLLEQVGVARYKVASMDVTNLPFLRYVGSVGKPVILSTGMANLGEIERAVEVMRSVGDIQVTLLHCVSRYPAEPGQVNLRTIEQLESAFGLPVGYSDHTLGNATALAAVALGAVVIEKHFTLDSSAEGADHSISAEPRQLGQLVTDIRDIRDSLGCWSASDRRVDRAQARLNRRGLFARMDIRAGTEITADMLKCVRPEEGLKPEYLQVVIGRRAKTDIGAEEPITFDVI